MPYIEQSRRDELELYSYGGCPWPSGKEGRAGELNYQLTELIRSYLPDNYSYSHLNDIVGALECCKQEFLRHIVFPYETQKCHDNGDVYE